MALFGFINKEAKYCGGRDEKGHYHGEGVLTYPDGQVFTGEFVNGEKTG
jgi:hypothetical protein